MTDENKKEPTKEEMEAQKEADTKLVGTFAKDLKRLGGFDSVRIFAVKKLLNGETSAATMSDGDFYSAYGFIQLWVKKQSVEFAEEE